jgi:hypothetical protein
MPVLEEHDLDIERPDFSVVPGPQEVPPSDAHPIEYVNLFLTDGIIDHLVHHTNLYAQQYVEARGQYLIDHPNSRVHKWLKEGPTNAQEVRAFLSIYSNIGLIQKCSLEDYWNTMHKSQSTPWFSQHMSRDRFFLLLKFLHFNDNSNLPPHRDPRRKLFKIRPIIDHFNATFKTHYLPDKDICIDESLVGFRGKTPQLRQYMPNKRHARFGMKLYCVCESRTGFLVHFEVYQGAATRAEKRQQPHGLVHALVLRLLQDSDLLDRGYHLTVDNFFASPALFQDLFEQNTTATGTVRRSRRGLPRNAISTRLTNQEFVERRKGPLLCVAFQDGQQRPILLSTEAQAGSGTTINRRGEEVQKPKVVLKYNHTMGGVDLMDSKLYMYLGERRSIKWTTKLFFNILGRAFLNAFILYEQNASARKKLSRHNFLVSVVEALAENQRPTRITRRRRTKAEILAARAAPAVAPAPLPPNPWSILEGHEMVHVPSGHRKDCVGQHARRTRTVWMCKGCNHGMCPPCFTPFHLKLGQR